MAKKKPIWKSILKWPLRARAESRRFERYHIVRIIHEGEKAIVYQARNPQDGSLAAIKSYKAEYNRNARRMQRRYHLKNEGELGLLLTPPGTPVEFPIVRTLSFGWEFADPTKNFYVIQEYVDALNLKHLIGCDDEAVKNHRLQIACAVARALAIVHEKKFVHRDVCTDNILVNRAGRAKLIDLGFMVPEGIAFKEKTGTPSYMSPEQFLQEPLHAATDIYSFGVVLYELFTGRLPFISRYSATNPNVTGRRVADLKNMHLHDRPAPPSALAPQIPQVVERLILRCLEKSSEDRYPSMRPICKELSQVNSSETRE